MMKIISKIKNKLQKSPFNFIVSTFLKKNKSFTIQSHLILNILKLSADKTSNFCKKSSKTFLNSHEHIWNFIWRKTRLMSNTKEEIDFMSSEVELIINLK